MKNISLKEYYSSPKWAEKRNERLKIDGYKCQKCGFTRALEVHHINYERLGNEDVSRDLVTLYKKCHKEIEDQKKATNPIKNIEHHSVYLAGKIAPNDWRNNFCFYRHPCDPNDIKNGYVLDVNDSLTITGPFFISCDHGCYHGDGKHGVGAVNNLDSDDEWGGCEGNYYTRTDVFNICKEQIDRADIVFAYINQNDCYGTLAEIGYAHAKGKDIVILFSNDALRQQMWFADNMRQHSGKITYKWINEQLYNNINKGGTDK